MQVQKIDKSKKIELESKVNHRPNSFVNMVGQEHIKSVLNTAIDSAKKRKSNVGHIILGGPSGYGKTTIANIIAREMAKNIKIVTGYAINKPAEIISILNDLDENDVLFIDEIHRLRPNIEEVLYIAMEDFVIDMVMPDGGNVRVPINPFTLVGATTKPESLTTPLKNRFVYNFHLIEYNIEEKKQILSKYLKYFGLSHNQEDLNLLEKKVDAVPREIFNFCIKLRDYMVSHEEMNIGQLDCKIIERFVNYSKIDDGGLNILHQKYLEILKKQDRPVGVKTIAIQLGVNEKSVEEDIEPLLLKLGKIEKLAKGRILV